MASLFSSPAMAEGYARWRPPVHPHVIDLMRPKLPRPVDVALDVGCGAGLSTAALDDIARLRIGIEPWLEMLRFAPEVAAGARFVAGRAEEIPLRSSSVDLVTAAGSLNWSDLDQVFPEIRRVLRPDGAFVLYDFSEGREFPDSPALSQWFAQFQRRYPSPPALEITPDALDARSFRLTAHDEFTVTLRLKPEFYLEYMLTETNVADAVRRGALASEIREWCRTTLEPVFGGQAQDVVFRGFIAYLSPR